MKRPLILSLSALVVLGILGPGVAGAASPDASWWRVRGNQDSALFGYSVSTAGDVNGDGFDDVVVGADEYDHGQNNEGRAFVYLGSAAGLVTTPAWTSESDHGFALFGYSVSTAGDVNGDGFDDVIVGAPFYTNTMLNEGQAFVYQGSASGLGTTAAWTAAGNQASAFFGRSVAWAGDVNGDGFDDVIVGATAFDNGQHNEGRSFVFHGSLAGLSTTPAWTAESDQSAALFGDSVAGAGDVNGDGFDDVIVGNRYFSRGEFSAQGRAVLFRGSASGPSDQPSWIREGLQDSAFFGWSVAGAGDVNGDLLHDTIVGAPTYEVGALRVGIAVVFSGAP